MEIDIQNKDFDKLMFPVHKLSENSNPLKEFPRLEKWPEFANYTAPLKKYVKVFKWIVLTYDMNSPFLKIDNVINRKLEVAKYVKLIDNVTEITDDVRKILLNNDNKVNKMIIAFVRMHRSSKYALIVGLENQFYEDLLISQGGGNPKRQLHITQKELENSVTNLFSRDTTPELVEDFNEYLENDRLDNIRPEDIAELLSQGKDPISESEIE